MKNIFIILILFQAGCRKSEGDNGVVIYTEDSEIKKSEIINADKKQIINEAKLFASFCLEDSDQFFVGVEDLMGDNIEVDYLPEVNQWSLFFTDGINSVFVRLDKRLGKGNVKINNGKFWPQKEAAEGSGFNSQEGRESAPRLFSITEFKTIAK